MPEYRRVFIPGGTYFFTVVTQERRPILTKPESRTMLRSAWKIVQQRHPFTIDAICLLPDHIHCIWTLPEGDTGYPLRWSEIKKNFTREYNKQFGAQAHRNASRYKRGEGTVWQRRFWEHTIRDVEDYHRHLDYIHYNPVKHGLVKNVVDWPWSSFHRYVKLEQYDVNWGEWDDDLACGE